jgi:tol-pal system protein YbgF
MAPQVVLSCLRGAAPLVLVLVMALPAAAQQDRTTAERLDRIERDMNMLQRQVYRGAPTSVPGSGDPATAANVEIRMERIEAQMRDLTGRVEEVHNGLDQLRQRVEQINSDIDVRLGGSGAAASAAPPGRPSQRSPPPPGDPGRVAGAGSPPPGGPTGLMPPGTVVPAPGGGGNPNSGGLNAIFNTLTPPGERGAPPPAAAPPSDAAAAEGDRPSGSPTHQFNHAFGLVKQADYPGAETALKAFIRDHPNDPLAGNAQYWLGETYYARNKYPEAAAAFAEGYKRYPKGPKAADGLLKLAMALAHADQKKSACVVLTQLDQAFPHPSGAIRDRAAAEKKRVGCS